MDSNGLRWRKSTRSGSGGNGNCVEVAHTGAIRDTKNPAVVLTADWPAFLSAAKRGAFDAGAPGSEHGGR